MPLFLFALGFGFAQELPVIADEGGPELLRVEEFSEPFDSTHFATKIPNAYTKIREGVLWTHGRNSKAKYPPMVYYNLPGEADIEVQFRYRFVAEKSGQWLWFFVDAEDGGGGTDHCVRVRFHPDKVLLQVDGKTADPNHPDRQPTRAPDKVSGLYRVPERLEPMPLDLANMDWRTVTLSFRGESLEVSLDQPKWSYTLKRPNFPHAKTKLLWMQNGGAEGIEIDDIRVKKSHSK